MRTDCQKESGSSAQPSPNKVVYSRPAGRSLRAISLISLVSLVALGLSGAEARSSSLNQDLHRQQLSDQYAKVKQAKPQLKQEYEGYYVPEEPYSATEDYLKLNAFIIGLKLATTYEYSDACVNNIVGGLDGEAYYANNITQHEKDMVDGLETTYFKPYLNYTGNIGGPVADALPNCYNFFYSFYTIEDARFQTFNSNYGNFFLAFLFNQMGNALNFQQKFERIQEEEEKQNYPGVYQEYGDLLYLIWTFQPIDGAQLEEMDSFVEKWLHDHEWLNEDTPAVQKAVVQQGVTTFSRFAHSFGEEFGLRYEAAKKVLAATTMAYHANAAKAMQQVVNMPAFAEGFLQTIDQPMVGQTQNNPDALENYAALGNGVAEGIVDVFPFESNPRRCQTNFTTGYTAFNRLFINRKTFDLYDTTYQSEVITDTAYILRFPFGVSYSCYWGFSTVLFEGDPLEDGILSEAEELEMIIELSNQIFTNLFFNLGYIYADVVAINELKADNSKYWKNLGIYSGDILIRFFWRRRFTRNFEYE